MFYEKNQAKDINIAYIGGGSRGWAWKLMADLACEPDICGTVRLYDIHYNAAKDNETIGNSIIKEHPTASPWKYAAVHTIEEALTGADFVIISILPGTFDEMYSDVHAPEAYGIYQAVGDTIGPGGIVRALRTLPMYREIANAIKAYSPDAWVINYTNPMSACTKTLYEVFPEIKAFGCCHEVFAVQSLMQEYLKTKLGITDIERSEIKADIIGVNHFTWVTKLQYRNMDLMPIYESFCNAADKEEVSVMHQDLFRRYGMIAAAANSHISEFLPGNWYLGNDEENRKRWNVYRKSVTWRKEDLQNRLEQSRQLLSGEKKFEMKLS
ncbi:MAG: alpha-glucosidase/alpha-galactosidase, partial [Clostridia bacterium]|nr:alpha-glucosidase/alpha-galactosidase [Clostridia bacterium]